MKMVEGGTVVEHLNEFNTVTYQLTSVDINFDDEVRALVLLSSLLKSWDDLVIALSNYSSSGTLKFDDVWSVLVNEEVRRKSLGESSMGGSILYIWNI